MGAPGSAARSLAAASAGVLVNAAPAKEPAITGARSPETPAERQGHPGGAGHPAATAAISRHPVLNDPKNVGPAGHAHRVGEHHEADRADDLGSCGGWPWAVPSADTASAPKRDRRGTDGYAEHLIRPSAALSASRKVSEEDRLLSQLLEDRSMPQPSSPGDPGRVGREALPGGVDRHLCSPHGCGFLGPFRATGEGSARDGPRCRCGARGGAGEARPSRLEPGGADQESDASHRSQRHQDVFTPDQKREIITRLTNAMVEIEGENMRP